MLSKPNFDGRTVCHGITMPDGFYRIVELTRHNGPNLDSQEARGYILEPYEGDAPCGIYEEATGKRVSERCINGHVDPITKTPLEYLRAEDPVDDDVATVGMPKSANRGVRRVAPRINAQTGYDEVEDSARLLRKQTQREMQRRAKSADRNA